MTKLLQRVKKKFQKTLTFKKIDQIFLEKNKLMVLRTEGIKKSRY